MIRKYTYGTIYQTYAAVVELEATGEPIPYFSVEQGEKGLSFSLALQED